MEITNEVKLKVALQYYDSCNILLCYNIENNPVIERFSGKNADLELFEPDFENKRDLLILKPLSSITDEDAIEVAKYWYSPVTYIVSNRDLAIKKTKEYLENPEVMLPLGAGQFLQSLGYDLPQYLLGGKTLKEAGLAIYE